MISGSSPPRIGVLSRLPLGAIHRCLLRHQRHDWGEVDEEDKRANDRALIDGTRLLSAYTVNGVKVWVITEAERSSTCVSFPEEY